MAKTSRAESKVTQEMKPVEDFWNEAAFETVPPRKGKLKGARQLTASISRSGDRHILSVKNFENETEYQQGIYFFLDTESKPLYKELEGTLQIPIRIDDYIHEGEKKILKKGSSQEKHQLVLRTIAPGTFPGITSKMSYKCSIERRSEKVYLIQASI